MPRIPETEIERIKREVDLIALVQSKGIECRKHGSKDLAARCPFHEDATASLIITPHKNIWHCMGCGKGGSVFDFVMAYEGVSFRHAYEVLAQGDARTILRANSPVKRAFTPKLDSPVAFDADDYTVMAQVIDYYHQRLKQTPLALEYLQKRGITEEAIDTFRIGYADRTLGLRLPNAVTKAGGEMRERLKKLGLLRAETGHEHFNGCVTFPITSAVGITEVYGRKVYNNLRPGTHYHLYLPGPHIGIFNEPAFTASREIILCESIIDALTFWCAGFRHVTTIYGTEAFTDELWESFLTHKTERIYLAYDRDKAGDRAADRDAARFLSKGIECYRIKFPQGMDANDYARKVTPPDRSLRLLIQSAEWLGKGQAPKKAGVEQPVEVAPAPSSLVAAKLAAEPEEKPATNEKIEEGVPVESVPETGDLTVMLGERQWRVRGLDKNNSHEVLRVNLRLWHQGLYYVNVVDLYQARQRQHYVDEAAKETLLDADLIKRDLGKLLLKLEQVQEERIRAALTVAAPTATMNDQESAEALALLRDPHLLDRILRDFDLCGIVGERTNKLTGYLAAISRKLDRPLALIIQSTSAAGKSALMEAVLSFVPDEEKIKYSAMTGQSLYYLGEKDLKNKILAIAEEEGAEKASYALKLLQSEGELTIASTSKDDQGRLKTEEYHVEGPVMIFLTTTAVDVDEELLNRCIVLTVDESREQTEAIHHLQREAETLAGLQRKLDRDRVWQVHRNAQRLLRSLHVVNPFAPRLTFLSDRTRTRRDHIKYLTLIRTMALLHQHQRPIQTLPNGTEYIEATREDIAAANRIAHEVLGRSLDELPPQTRKLLGLLQTMVQQKARELKMEPSDFRFSRRQVRDWMGWGNTQLKIHLGRLEDFEYLAIHRSPHRMQGYFYELLYDGRGVDGGRFLPGLIDVPSATYDADRSGQNGHRSGVGRPEVGTWSASGRDTSKAVKPVEKNGSHWSPSPETENTQLEANGHATS
ncbi:MAG: CHC2 zinc finger domain-containing protein [Methylacidiphilales bacterium]|nr:CHC2 zinc finger domain-containing protein [Candidatus Methylacidiphilales bacterium]